MTLEGLPSSEVYNKIIMLIALQLQNQLQRCALIWSVQSAEYFTVPAYFE